MSLAASNAAFAVAWGLLPFITSFYAASLSLISPGALVGVPTTLAALAEIRLSRKARTARSGGLPTESYGDPERYLRILVVTTCVAALALVAMRIVLG